MNTYTLGIDLHKRSSVWVLLDEDRNVLSQQSLSAKRADVPQAVSALGAEPGKITAVVEPVCGWRWYAEALESEGVTVKIANPSKIRLIADSRAKTDKNDALVLADLLRADFLPESYRAPEDINALRALVRERAYFVRIQTSIKNRIQSIIIRSGYMEDAGHPLRVKNREALITHTDQEVVRMYEFMRVTAERIALLNRELAQYIKKHPKAQLLMTMPGVGVVCASAIMAEVGDFSRFKEPHHLSSFAGLVPTERSSGSSRRTGHITKRGSRILRYTMVEAAFRVRAKHGLYGYYARLAEKTGKKRARVALARKMLTIMWHMVRNNTPYNEDRLHCMTKRDDLVRVSDA